MLKLENTTLPKRRKADRVPILIVENNADHWLIIRSVLAQCFPEVEPIWVNNAAHAVKYLENAALDPTKLPGLILLELHLPYPQDGWALIESIKAHLRDHPIPVVVLSHSADQTELTKAGTAGVAAYMVKPTTYQKWMKCIASLRHYWVGLATLSVPDEVEQQTSAEPTPSTVRL